MGTRLMFREVEMMIDEGLGYPKAYAKLCRDPHLNPYSHGPPFTFIPYALPHQEISFAKGLFEGHRPSFHQVTNAKEIEKSSGYVFRVPKAKIKDPKWQVTVFANLEDLSSKNELISDSSEHDKQLHDGKELSPESSLLSFQRTSGKPGFISFHGRPLERIGEVLESTTIKQSSLFWFIGPTVLVASFIFPSLYLRKILSSVFEDSLLTDFLILFFTEALFYCGVAIFLLLIDHLQKPLESMMCLKYSRSLAFQLVHRISSVVALVLSLIIPMVTMGLVWPWTGPAASATLAPYLVGIVVQFAFEQYAKYAKSPSWSVIPVIFQVYRLHQLNRAAQLVTALSFTVRGAETTAHNLAINSSLGTLSSVLQFLGVICIWSLSSFVMRFLPLAAAEES